MSRSGPPPPRAEDDADVVAVVVCDLEAGVGERLLGRGDAEDDVLVRAPDGLEVHPLRGVEVVDLAADLASYGVGSQRVIACRPELPSTRLSQAVGMSWPTGLMMPRPVTATRRVKSGRRMPMARRLLLGWW